MPGSGALKSATHTLLRVAAGLLFLQHGLQKIFGMFGGVPPSGAPVPLWSQFGAAGVIEIVGGVLIAAGLFVRPVAALLVIEMLVGYVQVHLPQGGWPIQNGGELALLYAVIFAYFTVHGGGAYSLDAQLQTGQFYERRRQHRSDRRGGMQPA
jgi:putative oxidoreductase